MKRFASIFTMLASFWGCQDSTTEIGKTVNEQEAVRIDAALQYFLKYEKKEAVIFGRTQEVCKTEGCWFDYELETESINQLAKFEKRDLGPLTALHVELAEGITIPTTMNKANLYCTGYFDVKPSEGDSSQCQVYFKATGVRYKP